MLPSMVKKLVSKSEFARLAGVSAPAVTKALRSGLRDAVDGKRIDAAHPAAVKYLQDKADAPTPVSTTEPAPGIDPLYEAALQHCQGNGRFTATNIQRGCKVGYNRACKILALIEASGLNKTAPPPPPKKTNVITKGHTAKNNAKKAESLAGITADIENGRTLHEIPEDIKSFAHMTLAELIKRFGTDGAFVDWLRAVKSIEDINEKRLKNAVTRGELISVKLVKTGVIEHFDTAFTKLLSDGAKTIARRVLAMGGAGRTVPECEEFVADQISSFIKPAKAKIARALKNV